MVAETWCLNGTAILTTHDYLGLFSSHWGELFLHGKNWLKCELPTPSFWLFSRHKWHSNFDSKRYAFCSLPFMRQHDFGLIFASEIALLVRWRKRLGTLSWVWFLYKCDWTLQSWSRLFRSTSLKWLHKPSKGTAPKYGRRFYIEFTYLLPLSTW